VRIVESVAAIPGAPTNGFIVDREYGELAAGQDMPQVTQQVWVAAGAQSQIETALNAAGVRVTSAISAADADAKLSREGPALASSLFLADAAAAALVAVGAAILGLYLSARRRRYEYAALEASGVPRRRLRRAVGIELAVVLGFGTVVGIATGLGAAALSLRAVPEFATYPAAPPLSYMPSAGPVAALLGIAVGLLVIVSVVLSITIIRGVRLEQLREAPA
jgi:putative ABC transport system permease protein